MVEINFNELKNRIDMYKEAKSKCLGMKEQLEGKREEITKKLEEKRASVDTLDFMIGNLKKEIEKESDSISILLKDLYAKIN